MEWDIAIAGSQREKLVFPQSLTARRRHWEQVMQQFYTTAVFAILVTAESWGRTIDAH